MVENLRKQAKTTLTDFDSGSIDRCSWAKRDVAQLIIMVSQIDWYALAPWVAARTRRLVAALHRLL
jgi:hypothetical protein